MIDEDFSNFGSLKSTETDRGSSGSAEIAYYFSNFGSLKSTETQHTTTGRQHFYQISAISAR